MNQTITPKSYHEVMRRANAVWHESIEASNDADSHQQRTEAWYALRARTLGGSEIATVLGECPYKSIKQLLAEKIGQTRFNGNVATRWGTLFEPVTRRYMERLLCLPHEIFEANSLPGCFPSQRYSPDGLAIVRLLSDVDSYLLYRILFEFKAPFSSVPAAGQIPAHYEAQVQCGLYSIMSAHAAIFANNIYRRVAFENLDMTASYCTAYHKGRVLTSGPFAVGVICFNYKVANDDTTTGTTVSDSHTPTIWNRWITKPADAPIDLGACSPADFDQAIAELSPEIIVDYGEPQLFSAVERLPLIQTHKLHPQTVQHIDRQVFEKRIAHENCVAYLPWKLMISDVLMQFRRAGWYEAAAPQVADFIEKLNTLHAAPNPSAALDEMFADRVAEQNIKQIVSDLDAFFI